MAFDKHFSLAKRLTNPFKWRLFWYFVLELFTVAMSLSFVYWSKQSIDIAMGTVDGRVRYPLAGVVISTLLGLLAKSGSSWLEQHTTLHMGFNLQGMLNEAQMLSHWRFVNKTNSGELITKMQEDTSDVVQMLSYSALSAILTVIKLVASFGFLWLMDPMLALMIIMITPLVFFSKVYFKKMRTLTQAVKSATGQLSHVIQENIRFRMLIRALGLLNSRERKLRQQQEQLADVKIKQINFGLMTNGVMKLVINGGYLVTFVWGVHRLHEQEISFGTMTAFLQLVGRIQTPILALMSFVPFVIRYRVSMDRIIGSLDRRIFEEKPKIISKIDQIVLNNLVFRYEDDIVIDQLSATIEAGQVTAIVGSSGKGKTTIIRLLLTLITPESGSLAITYGGQTEELSSAHRNNFSYVPQGNTLFSGTVRENLKSDGQNENDFQTKVENALYVANAEFVYDLPEGIDTFVGESGYGLSEGQAQRIAIARALMVDRPVWLFDEASSALDRKTSREMFRRLKASGSNKIIILVTHDDELASLCNTTIYMN